MLSKSIAYLFHDWIIINSVLPFTSDTRAWVHCILREGENKSYNVLPNYWWLILFINSKKLPLIIVAVLFI